MEEWEPPASTPSFMKEPRLCDFRLENANQCCECGHSVFETVTRCRAVAYFFDMTAPGTIRQVISQRRLIPAGRFMMGRDQSIADKKGRLGYELPPHPVQVSPFSIGATPVTVGMWRTYVDGSKTLKMPVLPEWSWADPDPMIILSLNEVAA